MYGPCLVIIRLQNHFRHPRGMGGREIEGFLTHVAVKRQVSASTPHQAFHAVVFLFKHILGKTCREVKGGEGDRLFLG